MDPWEWFDYAIGGGGDTQSALTSALKGLRTTDLGSAADQAELRAAIVSVQAETGAAELGAALAVVASSDAYKRSGWPNYFCAKAALAHHEPATVISQLKRIPPGFFDDQDKHWVAIHCHEMHVCALLDQDRSHEAAPILDRLVAEYAIEGLDDLYAWPQGVVERLLAPSADSGLRRAFLGGLPSGWPSPEDQADRISPYRRPASD